MKIVYSGKCFTDKIDAITQHNFHLIQEILITPWFNYYEKIKEDMASPESCVAIWHVKPKTKQS